MFVNTCEWPRFFDVALPVSDCAFENCCVMFRSCKSMFNVVNVSIRWSTGSHVPAMMCSNFGDPILQSSEGHDDTVGL